MKLKNVSRLILLFSIFFTTVLSGCVEEIDSRHFNQRQVVVNCILTSDSVQHLSLTYSNELHNTIYDEVEDATALLYEDGYLVGTFKKSAYAEWVLKYRPKFGRNYRLEVKVDGKELSAWRFGKDGLLHFNIDGKAVDQPLQVEISLGKETGIIPAGVFGKTGLPDPPRAGAPVQITTPNPAGKPRVIPVEALKEEVIY